MGEPRKQPVIGDKNLDNERSVGTRAAVAFDEGRHLNAGDRLTERSSSRVYRHALADGHTSFAILSGYCGDKELSDNQQIHAALQHDVRSARHGFSSLVVYAAEDDGTICKESWILVHDIPVHVPANL
jgi:hypothetical protein